MSKSAIEEMRQRLVNAFSTNLKPIQGLRVTADDSPRLPQSRIPSPEVKYDRAGRPAKNISRPQVFRKKPEWGGWL